MSAFACLAAPLGHLQGRSCFLPWEISDPDITGGLEQGLTLPPPPHTHPAVLFPSVSATSALWAKAEMAPKRFQASSPRHRRLFPSCLSVVHPPCPRPILYALEPACNSLVGAHGGDATWHATASRAVCLPALGACSQREHLDTSCLPPLPRTAAAPLGRPQPRSLGHKARLWSLLQPANAAAAKVQAWAPGAACPAS